MEKLIENEHFNIHIIENKKFKNDYLEVSFINKYDREKLAVRECLLRMLFMSNKSYKTSRDISIRTEELYDCIAEDIVEPTLLILLIFCSLFFY